MEVANATWPISPNPSSGRLRQGDCHKFQANLDYVVFSKTLSQATKMPLFFKLKQKSTVLTLPYPAGTSRELEDPLSFEKQSENQCQTSQLVRQEFFFFFFCFGLLRQGFSVQIWLSWHSVVQAGPTAWAKGVCHHCLANFSIFYGVL